MKTVKIAELKNRLSYYLRRVPRREALPVVDRDRVIALIERTRPARLLPTRTRIRSSASSDRASSTTASGISTGTGSLRNLMSRPTWSPSWSTIATRARDILGSLSGGPASRACL
jgi:antitoxin (DNA-binding transcriptional repressor) of toxin-antitoxin stability system